MTPDHFQNSLNVLSLNGLQPQDSRHLQNFSFVNYQKMRMLLLHATGLQAKQRLELYEIFLSLHEDK